MASRELFRAGAAALEFNAPLSPERAAAIVSFVTSSSPATVVDLGCGDGALLRHIVSAGNELRGVGVDTATDALDAAHEAAVAAQLSDRVEFVEGDASVWTGPADVVLCIGASHAWASPHEMFTSIASLGAGAAVVGDGVWQGGPDDWCIDTFGDQPSVAGLQTMAADGGWHIHDSSTSTLEEWDDFESTWVEGVRGVGTDEATAFADERATDYQRYRGVLGFAWLHLRR